MKQDKHILRDNSVMQTYKEPLPAPPTLELGSLPENVGDS